MDDLEAKIAREEHRQGRPYLADPEHCIVCEDVDLAWAKATCEHEWIVFQTWAGMPLRRICESCGERRND